MTGGRTPAGLASQTSGPVAVEQRVASVAVIVVTWNRRHVAEHVIRAIAAQDYPHDAMHVIVVDNGSTDGTSDHLRAAFGPDRIVENPTDQAHEPALTVVADAAGPNTLGFASLTLIHNHHNHGGCGGFNTGFAFVDAALGDVDFLWLVDDDVDLPPGALARLVSTARSDPRIGLVGSRAVNMHDRETTIETTVYFDFRKGRMCDTPPPGHPLQASHREWIAQVGGTKGKRAFEGVRDVDVVSACSLLARWDAVRRVGFWDHRFFIYCDDADWALRFARAGYRVVCDLQAVVYHTPWFDKLTPVRLYYAQRNAVWVVQKAFRGWALKRAVAVWMLHLLRDALRAALHRRLFHAEIIRQTASDIARNRGGRLTDTGPPRVDAVDALQDAGALTGRARVLFLCTRPGTQRWATALRDRVRQRLAQAGRRADEPEWVYMVRNDVRRPADPQGRVIEYGPRLRSRLRRQVPLLLRPARAVVVFDQINDVPLVRGRYNVHIDWKDPEGAQVERDGLVPRAAFLCRWACTAVRVMLFALLVRPYRADSRYG